MDSAPPRIHPCVCGFTCEKYSQMKVHREACAQWKNRPNPMGTMIDRRRVTNNAAPTKIIRHFVPCPLCHHRPDHHDSACPNSQQEKVRRDLIKKHEIDPFEFEVLLRLLAKRYPPPTA
jgi:hypothetical protein